MTLTLIGLGTGDPDLLAIGALRALGAAQGARFARAGHHPALDWVTAAEGGVKFDAAFDGLSDDEIVGRITEALGQGDVLYAVPHTDPAMDRAAAHFLAQPGSAAIRLFPAAAPPETGFPALVGVMARLRDPETGCPWDREQTPLSLRRYVIEEAYEVVEAIEGGDPAKLREELGDLLLQVVFHAQLAREENLFTIDDVAQGIVDKLIRRHPHVFGTVSVSGSDEVLVNWEHIKRGEQGYEDRTSILDGIPNGLPALMRALEASKRVVKVGFEWPTLTEVLDKVDEELAELRQEIVAGDTQRAAEELGDLLFTLVNVARQLKVDPEEALRRMTQRFTRRFRRIEEHAASQNRALQDLSLAEMESVWQAAKREQ